MVFFQGIALVAFILLVLVGYNSTASSQPSTSTESSVQIVAVPAIDPQTLIGEWWGDWEYNPVFGGRYFLTIAKTEGNKLYGKVLLTGRTKQNSEEQFEGTLNGSRVSIRAPSRTAELTIHIRTKGKRTWMEMEGTGYGTVWYSIKNLIKVK